MFQSHYRLAISSKIQSTPGQLLVPSFCLTTVDKRVFPVACTLYGAHSSGITFFWRLRLHRHYTSLTITSGVQDISYLCLLSRTDLIILAHLSL